MHSIPRRGTKTLLGTSAATAAAALRACAVVPWSP